MIKSGNNTIGKVYRVSQDARNLLKGSKDLGAIWDTDYPSNSTWTSTLNSDGVREYTQTAQSTELINRHLFVENKLPDSVLNLFIPGKTYTLSFEYKSNAQIFSAVSLRNSAYASVVSVIPNTTFPASTTWKRVSITQVLPTFITTDVTRLLLEASIHRNTHSVGDTASFRKFCLVEGTDTNWSPAASEVDVNITKVYKGSDLVYKLLPMPVVLYDKTLNKLVKTNNLTGKSANRYEPVGVVVIPAEHNVYGTGECGVMALMSASLNTPDVGQISNASITWGAYGTDYPELTNFNLVNKVGIESGTQKTDAVVNNILSSTVDYSYLPSDKNTADAQHTKAIDGTFYYDNNSDWNNCIPSPYLEDGSRNPIYYSTELSPYNALSDFAGKSNTEFLCSKATSQPDWRTDATITNNNSSTASVAAGYHPAACCCWRFHTAGTNQGDWYLPACGELGYAYVRFKKINDTISALQTHFGKTFCPLDTFYDYWSSSEYSSYSARLVNFLYGYVDNYDRNYSNYVRPFLRGNFETIN